MPSKLVVPKSLERAVLVGFFLIAIAGTCMYIVTLRNPVIINLYSKVERQNAQATRSSGTRQDLTWLLSYPLAGSSALMKVVQVVSNRSCATNYGEAVWTNWGTYAVKKFDSVPAYEGTPNGPFKFHHQLELPHTDLLTKTACSGYCMDEGTDACGLEDFIIPLNTLQAFLEACSSGTKFKGGTVEKVKYDSNRVKKGVVLIRDPIEILISRFTDKNKFKGAYSMNRRGLVDWCKTNDSRNSTEYMVKGWYTEEQKGAFEGTPCHAEFYRIVMWYNQAFRMLNETHKSEHIVHFEDLDTKSEKVVTMLFDFLHLKKLPGYNIPFDRPHKDLYDWRMWLNVNEMRNIKNFVYATASPKTRREFEKYFIFL